MDEEKRLIFYALKWIIERDSFEPELRKKMDKDICEKIVDLVSPKSEEESKALNKERDDLMGNDSTCGDCGVHGGGHGSKCRGKDVKTEESV